MSTEDMSLAPQSPRQDHDADAPEHPGSEHEPLRLSVPRDEDEQSRDQADIGSPTDSHAAHGNGRSGGREKQIKANKVYIGGLPENTRREDLQACFGKLGSISNIELKIGYGFVEFENRASAEEAVAEYHEGFFMGNKIRVELSHGGGRTAKYSGEPGACFKCGQHGHWARECPNGSSAGDGSSYRPDPPRGDGPRYYDYPPGPPARGAPRGGDYRYPNSRPVSPPRGGGRDYPRGGRDFYDDRRDYRGPPPLPPPRYDGPGGRPPYPEYDPRGGPYGGYPPPPVRDPYDRRAPPMPGLPPVAGAGPYVPGGRPRSPPRGRDDFDRSREFMPPNGRADYRGRSPPYVPPGAPPPRSSSGYGPPAGYRRRSMSPPRVRPPPGARYGPPYGGPPGPGPIPGPPGYDMPARGWPMGYAPPPGDYGPTNGGERGRR